MTLHQNILITGTSRGLGKAMAKEFLARGNTVIGCSRSTGTIEHNHYSHYHVDLASPSAIVDFFIKLRQTISHLDALINNAGIARMNAFALTPVESIHQVFDINVQGTFICCQKAIGLLRKASHPRIVNITTVAVPLKLEGEAVYAASKSAVEALTRIIAKELGHFRITCNAVGPSPINTDLIKGVGKEKIERLVNSQAIKTMATPKDVINVINFFLRPESDLISGQVIYLGGIS